MDTLKRHEIFEIEVLEKLKNKGFLLPLAFLGGTMLRLCYELGRYSTDLDFWFIKKINQKQYFERLRRFLSESYEITDANIKFNSPLIEIRSKGYLKRLKIEIRKGLRECDTQERIAFSKFSTHQVILRALTLEESMESKIRAGLDRKDIRDFFDIEFLARQGAEIKCGKNEKKNLRGIILKFKERDFKVSLGSLLEADARRYYIKNKFEYLLGKLRN